jgi:hypothetical protein
MEEKQMSDTKKRILEMLAQNKISADEAYRLLNALNEDNNAGENAGRQEKAYDTPADPAVKLKNKAKYLRVTITSNPSTIDDVKSIFKEDGPPEKVNVRVPMSLIRAGIKMKALIPPEAKDKINDALHEKGISFDIDSVKNEDIEELIEALGDMEVDIEGKHGEKVKVYVE